ncbi:hypothetical protein BNJ_00266 [Kaumoebavirus]|uniref:hypothetical protein n=1 Tax=Kaumoebavirus TaxID=1859492 RepID=UPI0009C3CD00|nr:hypothetical protein BNJ_00266 [Kaumoebavirus]ARA72090.1 hypothetical protein BNJ_00266 [Kaumoebavirus]
MEQLLKEQFPKFEVRRCHSQYTLKFSELNILLNDGDSVIRFHIRDESGNVYREDDNDEAFSKRIAHAIKNTRTYLKLMRELSMKKHLKSIDNKLTELISLMRDLIYAPGMPAYTAAKKDFDSRKDNP